MTDRKRCRDCEVEKPLTDFPLQPKGRQGRHPLCKVCRATQERERYRTNRRRLLDEMAGDPARRKRVRRRALERKYGLTEADVESLFLRQAGRCLVCWLRVPLVIDHDHVSGEVRGLLCSGCNLALGSLNDSAERCRSAAAYLRGDDG
jgi:hypothetical protein